MGTRSVVAVPTEGGHWRGRYVHWDGYPEGVGAALVEILRRDGYATTVRTLTEDHYGWSSVNAEDAPSLGLGYTDGRFVAVPGYGVAYTTADNQSGPEDWITDAGPDWGTEWAYVLTPDGIMVFERVSTLLDDATWSESWEERPRIDLAKLHAEATS